MGQFAPAGSESQIDDRAGQECDEDTASAADTRTTGIECNSRSSKRRRSLLQRADVGHADRSAGKRQARHFIHNSRAGGRSLEGFLNVKRLSHAFPVDRLSEKDWCENLVVTSVRHPLNRFISGYFGFVMGPGKNSLVKLYGWGIKDLDALSSQKPRADLVLFEDIGNWQDDMREAGIDVGDRKIPHIGKSGNKKTIGPEDVRPRRGGSFCLRRFWRSMPYRRRQLSVAGCYRSDLHLRSATHGCGDAAPMRSLWQSGSRRTRCGSRCSPQHPDRLRHPSAREKPCRPEARAGRARIDHPA